jgi:hypothetical protein
MTGQLSWALPTSLESLSLTTMSTSRAETEPSGMLRSSSFSVVFNPDDVLFRYINQNQFYRQIRNIIFDLTLMNRTNTDEAGQPYVPTGIHWQVAQATSLQNLHFQMPVSDASGSTQVTLSIFSLMSRDPCLRPYLTANTLRAEQNC